MSSQRAGMIDSMTLAGLPEGTRKLYVQGKRCGGGIWRREAWVCC
jgi:hypothetical protein